MNRRQSPGPSPQTRAAGRVAAGRRSGSSPLLVLALAAVLLPAATPAHATSVRPLTLDEIAASADRVVQARVEAVRSYWEGTRIWTEVTLAVGRTLKGGRSERLTFVQIGGRVENPVPLAMTVPGTPVHRVGEEAYFFLEPGAPGQRVIVGLFRGHVPIRHDERGAHVMHEGRRLAPAEFEEEVRRALERGGGAAGRGARPAGEPR
jgi:hypothetical protein